MAAVTQLDGPDGKGFVGRLQTGFNMNIQYGRASFNSTDTRGTMSLKSGGMTGTPMVFVQYESAVDKTVLASISGTTITFDRTDTTSGGKFSYLICWMR